MDRKLSHYLDNTNFRQRYSGPKQSGQLIVRDNKIVLDNEKDDEKVTSMTFGRHRDNVRWSDDENCLFFEAIKICGTDFSLIERLYKNKTRRQIKCKFLREEKKDRKRIDDLLKCGEKFSEEEFDRLRKKYAAI